MEAVLFDPDLLLSSCSWTEMNCVSPLDLYWHLLAHDLLPLFVDGPYYLSVMPQTILSLALLVDENASSVLLVLHPGTRE